MNYLWIIQDSNGKHYNWTELFRSVNSSNSKAIFVAISKIQSFSIPPDVYSIIIGGDDYLLLAKKNPSYKNGIFDNPDFFNVINYLNTWKDKYLNFDTKLVLMSELKQTKYPIFIRPINDDKSFDGKIINAESDLEELENLHYYNKICVASAKTITREWRAVIVNNCVITVCQYVKNGENKINAENVPKKVFDFCRRNCNIAHSPLVWIMDVAEANGKLFVLECNIFNASNFYDCDRGKVVKALEEAICNKL